MRMLFVGAVGAVVMTMTMACRIDTEIEEAPALARATISSLSDPKAWRLFDRSTSVGFTPSSTPLLVTLDHPTDIVALKVHGSAPYRLHIGSDVIDMSGLSAGWHTFDTRISGSSDHVELGFELLGAPAPVNEIELWSANDGTSSPPSDLTANSLPAGWPTFASTAPRAELAPGACAKFPVPIARPSSQLRHAHLVYEASGLARAFELEHSVNSGAPTGGSWLGGSLASRAFSDEIDPSALNEGINHVRLCTPADATHMIAIEKLRIVGELDRGVDLAIAAAVGRDRRDGRAIIDHDPSTSITVAPGEPLEIEFDRLIAPDAIELLPVVARPPRVECVDRARHSVPLVVVDRIGPILRLEGAAAACASLVLSFDAAVTLASVDALGSGAAEPVDWPRLVVTSAAEHFGDRAWVGGFIAHPRAVTGAMRVEISGQPETSSSGDFGTRVERGSDPSAPWPVEVTARFSDGSSTHQTLMLDRDRHEELSEVEHVSPGGTVDGSSVGTPFGAAGQQVVVRASGTGPASIRLGARAGVDVPAGALGRSTDITVRHLASAVVPPLDPGLVNVTAPQGHGYEFLPHGQRFAKAVEVVVPFDRKLVPEGMTVDDVHTYFYDQNTRRWRRLERRSIDAGNEVVRSTTDHFTVMIDAVLATPTNPTPLSFDPTTLSTTPAASPAAGIDLIEPPQATSSGDAHLSLPIRVPPGRGDYSPSLAITYASSNGNGWLGVGWDLAMPRIEIDTRWGVPSYADGDEPRYLLDGAEMIPTVDAEGPSCTSGTGRRYHLRIEGAFAHILRCGSDPSNFTFEVRDRNGTKLVYGGTLGNASLTSTKPRPGTCNPAPCAGGIARWYLRSATDVDGNTTTFSYQVDSISGPEPAVEVYPASISYTSHPQKPAHYAVEFVLDSATRPDRVVSGRGGFKRVTRRLLREVRVKLDAEIIRDYVLTYGHGQFEKSVLTSVREFGAGGCAVGLDAFSTPSCATGLLEEHRFEYLSETYGFGLAKQWQVQGDPLPSVATLGRGKSENWSGGISIGVQKDAVSVTVGASGSIGTRLEMVGMYDVDGNGLIDQVFDTGSATLVLYNQGAALATFSTAGPGVTGLQDLGREGHSSWGVDASAGIVVGGFGASASGGFAHTTTRSGRFLTDLDGDGFVDVVGAGGSNGQTLFSMPCATGQCFAPGGFGSTMAIDPREDPLLKEFKSEIDERLVLGDPVVQWVAPYTGIVDLSMLASTPSQVPTTGVRVDVFLGDALLGSRDLNGLGQVSLSIPQVQITAGQAVYLRVATGADDGIRGDVLRDAIFARIEARYTSACTDASCQKGLNVSDDAHEPTGVQVFTFETSQDLRVHAVRPFRAPAKGLLNLHGLLIKQPSAADVRYCVQRFSATATRTDFRCDDPNSPATVLIGPKFLPQLQSSVDSFDLLNIAVDANDSIVLRAESDYSFDPSQMSFIQRGLIPMIEYTAACVPDDSGGCTTTTDASTLAQLPVDTTSLGFFVARVSAPEPLGAVPMPLITPAEFGNSLLWKIEPFPNPLAGAPIIEVAIRSDRQGTMHVFPCTTTCTPPITFFHTGAEESLSIEVRTDAVVLPWLATVTIKLDSTLPYEVPLIFRKRFAQPLAGDTPFVGGYRSIYATIWAEQVTFEPTRLLDDLRAVDLLTLARRREIALSAFAPNAAYSGFSTHFITPAWVGPGSSAMVGPGGVMHAARLGAVAPDLPGVPPVPDGGVFSSNYARLSGTRTYYAGAGVQGGDVLPPVVFGASLTGTVSRSTTKTTTDVFDVTGDGIADVVAGDRVYEGSLSGTAGPIVPGFAFGTGFRRRVGADYSVGFGSSASLPRTSAGGRRLQEESSGPKGTLIGVSTSKGLSIGRSQTTQDIADINGDGLPDLVQRSGTAINVRYNFGTSLGGWETIGTVSGALLTTPIDGFQSSIEALSLFGLTLDSTADALTHETTLTQQTTRTIGFLFGKTTNSTRTTSSRITRQLIDLNGDGLPDLLFKRDGEPVLVQFNRGADFGPVMTWETPTWGSVQLAPPFDSKFDALIVAGPSQIVGPDVLGGTGSQASSSLGASVSIPIVPNVVDLSVDGSRAQDTDTYELALVDVTGDGAPDHVLRRGASNAPGAMYVKQNLVTGRANLLNRVRRPLGGTITLEYQSLGNTVDLPQRHHVLTRVDVDDGVDLGASFSSPTIVTTFSYQGGRYDRSEKEPFGFAKVTTRRADGVQIEQQYDTHSFALRGRLIRERRLDAQSHVLDDHAITYELKSLLGPNNIPIVAHTSCRPKPRLGLESCTPRLPVVVREDETRTEGAAAAKTLILQTIEYDRFGNRVAATSLGDDAVPTDDTLTTIDYNNDTTRWILGRPTSLALRGLTPELLLRSRTGVYNARGKLIQLSVDTGNGVATTELDYDTFGNLAHVATPPNELGDRQNFDVTFDGVVATYPVEVRDGFGNVSTAEYDLRFGVATTETDINRAELVRHLDAFGRVTAVIGPYDSVSEPGLTIEYHPEASPPSATTIARSSMPTYGGPLPPPVTAVTFSDGLGRAIELRTTSVVDGVSGTTTSAFVKRDALGREVGLYVPFFTAGASTAFVTPTMTAMTSLAYDLQDRVTRRTYPDNAAETTSFAIATQPSGGLMFQTLQVDANGHTRETFADQLGRLRTYIEHPTTTESAATEYAYLASGDLSQITDAEGNTTAIDYDLRGLRTSLENGDVGRIQTTFDLMGNRTGQVDPDLRQTRYRYDRDRLVAIDYPTKPDVTYTYGDPGASDGGAGRIIRVNDESGEQQTFYGALGEITRTIRTVAETSEGSELTFDTRFVTDSFGRQLEVTYPDGEVVTNVYDAAGKLAEVRGAGAGWTRTYADQLRYDVFGNRTRLRLGNGTVTTWGFDPLRVRLSSVVTTLPGAPGTKIQDLHYGYDPGSNPTQITNTLATLTGGSGNRPGASTLTLTYDGVDQLRHAVGDAQLDPSRSTTYDQTFEYSPSHNLVTKRRDHLIDSQPQSATTFSASYTYPSGRPHLPDTIGTLQIEYDASGNPIHRVDSATGLEQTLVWDDDHRLVQVTGDGVNQRNVYDASGLRVRRTTKTGDTTVFASPYFDVANSTTGIKHIFAGDLRVASSLSSFSSGAEPSPPAEPGTPYYFHRDHLGSTAVVTTANATVHQSLEYFVDGETWIDRAPQTPVSGFLYNGKPFDTDTNLYDFGQRFYDPRSSQWLGVDTAFTMSPEKAVARPAIVSVGTFAMNSPVRFTDPDGRDVRDLEYITQQRGNSYVRFSSRIGIRYGSARTPYLYAEIPIAIALAPIAGMLVAPATRWILHTLVLFSVAQAKDEGEAGFNVMMGIGTFARFAEVLNGMFRSGPVAGGAGGVWRTVDEEAGFAIGQANDTACGAACGEMLTGIPQGRTIMRTGVGYVQPEHLARALGPRVVGGYLNVGNGTSREALTALLKRDQPWIALLGPQGKGHYVYVEAGLRRGMLSILDPWDGGSRYLLSEDEFLRYWPRPIGLISQ